MKTVVLLTGLTFLAACETTAGFGRDVSALGEEISEEAREAR